MNNDNNEKVFKVLTKKIPYSIAVKYYNNPMKCKTRLNLTDNEYDILIDKLYKYMLKVKDKDNVKVKDNPTDTVKDKDKDKVKVKDKVKDKDKVKVKSAVVNVQNKPVAPPLHENLNSFQSNGTINNQLLDRRFFSLSPGTLTEPMRMTVSSQDMIPSSQNNILRNRTFDVHIPQGAIPIIDRTCTGTRMFYKK
jgi:hypothetical protein